MPKPAAYPPLVVLTKPIDEFSHYFVPPHPDREAHEASERLFCCLVRTSAASESIHAVPVGPVRLVGLKALFLNETLRDFCLTWVTWPQNAAALLPLLLPAAIAVRLPRQSSAKNPRTRFRRP
jgi:hypothetical protein